MAATLVIRRSKAIRITVSWMLLHIIIPRIPTCPITHTIIRIPITHISISTIQIPRGAAPTAIPRGVAAIHRRSAATPHPLAAIAGAAVVINYINVSCITCFG